MSKNLTKKLQNLTLIEDWYEAAASSTYGKLEELFSAVLVAENVFANIYVAIRNNPQSAAQEATESFTYYNVGFTISEITKYFNTKFGLNYFAYNYEDQMDPMIERVRSIYKANKYKYMKLIEIMGYKYNPLYNVDGIELYGNAETIGDSSSTRKPEGTIKSVTGKETNNTMADMESTNYVNPFDETAQATQIESQNKSSPVTSKQTFEDNYHETSELNHNPAMNYKYDSESGKWIQDQAFVVAASDNAFGVTFTGPERYYAEKRIRQGNIGVTKSQELVKAQRDVVQYNILDEFFRDLEREIVIGIF